MGREVLAFEWEEEDRVCSNFFCIKTFLTPLSEQVRFFDPPPISNPSSWPLPKVSVLLRLALFNKQKDKRRELTLKFNQRGSFRLNLQASIYKGAENYVLFQHIAHLQSYVSRKRFHQGRISVWQCSSILSARGPCPPSTRMKLLSEAYYYIQD